MKGDADYQWLEQVEGEEALAWVEQTCAQTVAAFESDPDFAFCERAALEIMEADDRIPFGVIRGDQVYNFWQDADQVRGLWRRTSRSSYESAHPEWETVLDLDQLAEAHEANWVWKGATVNASYTKALLQLSDGGKDAIVVREFDLITKTLIDDGFTIPEAKTYTEWLDDDTILVGTDFGEGSLTESGYPAIIKRWGRGQSLADATTVHEIARDFMLAAPVVQHRSEATYQAVLSLPDFFTSHIHLVEGDSLRRVAFPDDIQFQGFFAGQAIGVLRSTWRDIAQGSLIALDLATDEVAVLYQPDATASVSGATFTRDAVVYAVVENVVGALYLATYSDRTWTSLRVPIEGMGTVDLLSASDDNTECFATYADFLTPPSLIAFTTDDPTPRTLHSQPPRFDADNLRTRQRFATSSDGTKVPYFVIDDPTKPGPKRTLLYGYGGFEIPLTPSYGAVTGRLWLEAGNAYAVANIRGGGEFGPAWHQAALKLNRHKAFEDFEAIAHHLVETGQTTPDRLAIRGGSNGGLLVGTVFTRSPELCAGVICLVPLLDMLRYHLLLAGTSWVGEYGDPSDPAMADYLSSYSPFHQVKPDVTYPQVFFSTSTRDDRVHPGHARKMVARMIDQGHSVFYYENTEGGHSSGANLKQHARLAAMEHVYLKRVLTR